MLCYQMADCPPQNIYLFDRERVRPAGPSTRSTSHPSKRSRTDASTSAGSRHAQGGSTLVLEPNRPKLDLPPPRHQPSGGPGSQVVDDADAATKALCNADANLSTGHIEMGAQRASEPSRPQEQVEVAMLELGSNQSPVVPTRNSAPEVELATAISTEPEAAPGDTFVAAFSAFQEALYAPSSSSSQGEAC